MIGMASPPGEQDSLGRMFDPINDACQLDRSSSQHQGSEMIPQRPPAVTTKKKAQKMPRDLSSKVEHAEQSVYADTHPALVPKAPPRGIAPPPPMSAPDAVATRCVAPPPPPRQRHCTNSATSQSCFLQRDVAPPPPPPPPRRNKAVSPPLAPAHGPGVVQTEPEKFLEPCTEGDDVSLSQEWHQKVDAALESVSTQVDSKVCDVERCYKEGGGMSWEAQADVHEMSQSSVSHPSEEVLQSNASAEKAKTESLHGDGQWQAGRNEMSKVSAPGHPLENEQSEASTSSATEEIYVGEEKGTHVDAAPSHLEVSLVVEDSWMDIQNASVDAPGFFPSLEHEPTNETPQLAQSSQLVKSEEPSEISQIQVNVSFGAESQNILQSEAHHQNLDYNMPLYSDVAPVHEASAPQAIETDIGSWGVSDLNHNDMPAVKPSFDTSLPRHDLVDVPCQAEDCTDTSQPHAACTQEALFADGMTSSAVVDDSVVASDRDGLASTYGTQSGSPKYLSKNNEEVSESSTSMPLHAAHPSPSKEIDVAPLGTSSEDVLGDSKHDGITSCEQGVTSIPLGVEPSPPSSKECCFPESGEAAENPHDECEASSWVATPKPPPPSCPRFPTESKPCITTPLPRPAPPGDHMNVSPCAYGDVRLRGIVPPPPPKRRGDVPGPPATQRIESIVAPPPPKKPPAYANESANEHRAESQAKPSLVAFSESSKPKSLSSVASAQRSEVTERVGDDTKCSTRVIARTEAYTPQYPRIRENQASQPSRWSFDQFVFTKKSRDGQYVEINLQGKELDDAGLSKWCKWAEEAFPRLGLSSRSEAEVSRHYLSLNLADNRISDSGMEVLSCFLAGTTGVRLRQLRMHKNRLGAGSAVSLARLIGALGSRAGTEDRAALEELHLSHNRLGLSGIMTLLHSVAAAWAEDASKPLYPLRIPCRSSYYYKPLWLRVEYNGQDKVDQDEFIEKVSPDLRQKRESLGWLQPPSEHIPMACLGRDVHKCTLDWCYQQCGDQGPVLHIACWGGDRAQCARQANPKYTSHDRQQQYSNRQAGHSSSYGRTDQRYASNQRRQGSSSYQSPWQTHQQWRSQEAPPRAEATAPPLPPGPPPRSRENQLASGSFTIHV